MPPANRNILTGRQLSLTALTGVVLLLIVLIGCSWIGRYSVRFTGGWQFWIWPLWTDQVWQVRIFRLLAACLVGSSLATAGMALQALMRNPLAEPYLLGISSGAGVGVLLGPVLAAAAVLPGWLTTPVLAMTGALLTSLAVYLIAQRSGRLDPYILLLSGVIVNVFNSALIMAVLQFVKQTDMINYIGWGMGHIPESLWFKPGLMAVCGSLGLSGWCILLYRAASYNMLGLGDEVAASGGVSVVWLRVETFIVVSIMTSAAVALSGPIGFVGLIVPHICRLIWGPDHRRLVIVCGFGGAIFLMLADTLCRIIGQAFQLGELPVGVFTAIIGGPLFISLLRRRQQGGSL